MVPVCLIKPDDCFVLQFEQALGSLPDSRLPVANQLEQAITTIKSNVKVILDIQGENKVLKKVGEKNNAIYTLCSKIFFLRRHSEVFSVV